MISGNRRYFSLSKSLFFFKDGTYCTFNRYVDEARKRKGTRRNGRQQKRLKWFVIIPYDSVICSNRSWKMGGGVWRNCHSITLDLYGWQSNTTRDSEIQRHSFQLPTQTMMDAAVRDHLPSWVQINSEPKTRHIPQCCQLTNQKIGPTLPPM